MSHDHSGKLSSLIRLCFTAGIVFEAGQGLAASCNLNDASVCVGPWHAIPSVCDQYPYSLACVGSGNSGSTDTVAATSLAEIINDPLTTRIPHVPTNSVQASCASPYEVRLASAMQDAAAWWPSFGGWSWAWPGVSWMTMATTYSNGQREIWAVFVRQTTYDSTTIGSNPNPSLGLAAIATFGPEGPWGIYGQYKVAEGGIWGGGPAVYEYCQ